MRASHKSFPLKDGQCIVYPDKLEIEISGLKGIFIRWINRRKLTSVGFWYVMAGLGFFIATVLSAVIDNWFLAFFFLVFVVLCVIASWRNRHSSLRTQIPRKMIQSIDYQEAIQGESRATFDIHFQPQSTTRIRRLNLPGRHQQGSQVANAAFWILKEEGLISKD